jgi:EmrB/QacA subfamily drug resistance transporter
VAQRKIPARKIPAKKSTPRPRKPVPATAKATAKAKAKAPATKRNGQRAATGSNGRRRPTPTKPIARAAETPQPGALSHRQILVVFSGLMAGMLLAALDQTIVSTALPTIVGELGGIDHLSWVVTAYLLTSTAVVPLYGKISDLYGRKIVFQTAIVIFLIGSVLSGLSQSMLMLIVFRGIQGLGGGGLMAMAMAIIGDVVSPRQRGRYVGYLGAVFAASSVIGPLVGGFFVDSLSWRWIFYINLPVGIVALFVTSSVLKLPFRKVQHRIDFEGAALLVAGVVCLLFVCVWGGVTYPWSSPIIVSLAGAAAVLLVAFVLQERRVEEPLLPLRLFSDPIFSVSTVVSFLVGIAMFGAMVFLPVYLQAVKGASATRSGLLVLPLMLGLMSMSVLSGRIISRTGHYKTWPVAGMGIAAVGVFLLSRMDANTSRVQTALFMVVVGAGLGMVMQVLLLAVQNSAPHADLGVATSAVNFFRQMGATLGVAVFGAIFSTRLGNELSALLPAGHGLDPSRLANGPEQIKALPPEIHDVVVRALSHSLQTVFLCGVPVLLAGFGLSWLLRQIPLRDTVHVGTGEGHV